MNTEKENNTNSNNHSDNQKNQNIFISLVLVAIFIGALVIYTKYYSGNILQKPTEQVGEVSVNLIKNCGITIDGPLENASVGQAFTVDATLDNSEREMLGCSWTSFEAQAGVVYVKDGYGTDLATPTPLSTSQDWMTDAPVNYFADIKILNNYTGPALVIINEDDPSGEKISKTISFPVTIK